MPDQLAIAIVAIGGLAALAAAILAVWIFLVMWCEWLEERHLQVRLAEDDECAMLDSWWELPYRELH